MMSDWITPLLSAAAAAVAAFGAVKFSLGSLTAEVKSMGEWLRKVADGERFVDGKMQQQLDDHDRRIFGIEKDGCRLHQCRGEG